MILHVQCAAEQWEKNKKKDESIVITNWWDPHYGTYFCIKFYSTNSSPSIYDLVKKMKKNNRTL